jgi:hypothetical protein
MKCENKLCNNIGSPNCDDLYCSKCCKSNTCKRHKNSIVKISNNDSKSDNDSDNDNDSENHSNNEEEYKYENWFEYKKESTLILNEYIIPDLSNIVSDYLENKKAMICILCGACDYYNDERHNCYICYGCENIYCTNCNDYTCHYTKCGVQNCYYCRRGHCFNVRREEEMYCNNCYVETSSDESESDEYGEYDEYLSEEERRTLLQNKLSEFKLTLRKDSKLCKKYIEKGDEDIDDVAERMCQMHYLYNYCDMKLAIEQAEKEQEEELNAGYIPDCTVFQQAELIALSKNNNSYPKNWPWL